MAALDANTSVAKAELSASYSTRSSKRKYKPRTGEACEENKLA